MKKLIILGAASVLMAGTATAQKSAPALKPLNVAQMQGMYGGTFLCSSGEMGMTLTVSGCHTLNMTKLRTK